MRIFALIASALLVFLGGCTDSADVLSHVPPNGARDVPTDAQIVVTFSRAMNPDSVTPESFIVEGKYYGKRYEGQITASEDARTFTFEVGERDDGGSGFVPGDEVHVRLTDRIVGKDRIPFEGYEFLFFVAGELPEVYTGPPRVTSTDPAPQSAGVPLGTPVTIHFSRAVTQTSAQGNIRALGEWTGLHTGSVSFSGSDQGRSGAVVFVPETPFLAGEPVRISVSNKIFGVDPDDAIVPAELTFSGASAPVSLPWDSVQLLAGIEAQEIRVGDLRKSAPGLEAAFLDGQGGVLLATAQGAGQMLVVPWRPVEGTVRAIGTCDPRGEGVLRIVAAVRAGNSTVLKIVEPRGFGFLAEDPDLSAELPGRFDNVLGTGDLNGDGRFDIVAGGPDGLALVVRGGADLPPELAGLPGMEEAAPSLVFSEGFFPQVPAVDDLKVFDASGDFLPDVVFRCAGELFVILNEPGGLKPPQRLAALEPGGLFFPLDLTGDGKPEIVLVHPAGQRSGAKVSLEILSKGEEGYETVFSQDLPLPPARELAGCAVDTSADGSREIVLGSPVWSQLATIFFKDVQGSYELEFNLSDSPGVRFLAPLDIDLNGTVELLASGPGGIYLFEGQAAGAVPTLAYLRFDPRIESAGGRTFTITVLGRSSRDFDEVRIGVAYPPDILQLVGVNYPQPGFFNTDNSTITTCSAGQGCTDHVIAALKTNLPFTIRQEVALFTLTFRFTTQQSAQAVVRLEHGLTDADGKPVDSAFHLAAENAWVVAGLEGGEAVLETKGQLLAVSCDLDVQEDGLAAKARISWESPRGDALPTVRVHRNGSLVASLSGPGAWTDDVVPPGENTYEVEVEGEEGDSDKASCSLTFVPSPIIDGCSKEGSDLVVRWHATGPVDGFVLWRDNTETPWRTFGPEVTEYREPDDPTGTGHLFGVSAVLGETRSKPALCSSIIGGSQGVLRPPRQFTARLDPQDPFRVLLSWESGEGYEGLALFRNGEEIVRLAPVTSYEDGPLAPGTYSYALRPIARGTLGDPVAASPVTVDLPLNANLSCHHAGGSQIELSWDNGSTPYDHFSYEGQVLKRLWISPGGTEVDRGSVDLSPEADSYTDTVDQLVGTYRYEILVRYAGELHSGEGGPPGCEVRFATEVYLEPVVTGAGLEDVPLVVQADLVDTAQEIEFRFRYQGGAVDGGDKKRLIITGWEAGPGLTVEAGDPTTTDGVWYSIEVRLTGSVGPGEKLPLVTFFAKTEGDFALYGYDREPPDKSKAAVAVRLAELRVHYPGDELLVLPPADSTVTVSCRYILVQSVSGLSVGDTFAVPVFGTFEKPLIGFNIAFSADKDTLEVLGGTLEETDTPRGLFYAVNVDPQNGTGVVAWIAQFQPQVIALPPGFHRVLAYLQFKAVGVGGSGEEISFGRVNVQGQSHKPMLNPLGWVIGDYLEAAIGADVQVIGPPEVSEVKPNHGPLSGGNTVEIHGSGFGEGSYASVRFDTEPAEVLQARDDLIVCRVPPLDRSAPPAEPVTVSVTVRTRNGQAELPGAYSYEPLRILNVRPDSGPVIGGHEVRIEGRGIPAGVRVFFGSRQSTVLAIDRNAGTFAVVRTPEAEAPGPVDVELRSPDGQVAGLSNGYTYTVLPPAISSLDPDHGPASGGTTVLISGENFIDVLAVLFGTAEAASFTVLSESQIEAVSPPGPEGDVALVVRTSQGEASAVFHYDPVPFAVTGIAPDRGTYKGGTQVVLTGRGFEQGSVVYFGETEAPQVEFVSATELHAVSPPGTGAVTVICRLPGGKRASAPVPFTYVDTPASITDFQPRTGPASGGTVVTISGANFIPETEVLLNGTPIEQSNVVYHNQNELKCRMPPGAGQVTVAVRNPGTPAQEAPFPFTYTVPSVSISGIEPDHGSRFGDTLVTITGGGFFELTEVLFDGNALSSDRVTFVSTNELQVLTPPHEPGSVTISVRNPGGEPASLPDAFTYEPFAVTEVTPTSGSICGAARVTFQGASFHEGVVVRFGQYESPEVRIVDEHRLVAFSPQVPPETGQVTLRLSYGGIEIEGPVFTYRGTLFVRGDVNGDGTVDRRDVTALLSFIHGVQIVGGPLDAADVDDNGLINTADAWYLLSYLFTTGAPPPEPFPEPGEDPTADTLEGCAGF